jgi:hypothetical protein
MTDYCTQNVDEDAFNDMMLACGLCVEVDDGEGYITVEPASYQILIDRIGPITLANGTVYPEYYTNVRLLLAPTDEQAAALTACSIDPSQPQYRTWA